MAVTASYTANLTGTEGLLLTLDNVTNPTVTHDIGASAAALTVTKIWSDQRNVSTGDIDLTALTNGVFSAVDFTGIDVNAVKITADSGNATDITFTKGLTNGYEMGGASWQFDVAPGATVVFFFNGGNPNVGASAKMIDVAGTSGDLYDIVAVG